MTSPSAAPGRLHQREREHLHEVVLDDVPQRPGLLVELAAALDAEALGDHHLDVVDVAPVPDRLEDRVGEPQRQDVLHRLLAHVVVDAEDLGLVEVGVDVGGEPTRAVEVGAEGLLDDERERNRPACRAMLRPTWPRPRTTTANCAGTVAR